MTVSIIIAVKNWRANLEECIAACRKLDFADFEILVLPDSRPQGQIISALDPRLVVIPTGPVLPAQKRDIALKHAKGRILAFLDDDAYPAKGWLSAALKHFSDARVAAVGGPAVTPPQDSPMQQASGWVYSSPLVSAEFMYRYIPAKKRAVDDYPSCNFLVRKEIMEQLGGFNTKFWPGEDTKLCLDITRKLGKKIIYDPEALVYHHRRSLFTGHIRQVAAYALHRGYFVKAFPETSRRIAYFMPALFLLCVASGAMFSFVSEAFRTAYFAGLLLYLGTVLVFSLYAGGRLMPLVFLGIIATHLTYGACFIKGLLARRLKEG